jgi:hypothetical protein
MDMAAGVTAMETRVAGELTVNVAGGLVIVPIFAVMPDVPAATPVASPVAEIVATLVVPEVQIALALTSCVFPSP